MLNFLDSVSGLNPENLKFSYAAMHLFMEQSRNHFAIRFWNNPMQKDIVELSSGKKYILLSLPFYYAGIIDNILKINSII